MLSTYSLILLSLFTMSSATGHLRLQLTSSHHFALYLKTNSSSDHRGALYMGEGVPKIVSFHPKSDQEAIEITFDKRGSQIQKYVYEMRTSAEAHVQTIILNEIVLNVQSFFVCDTGYVGDDCQLKSTTTSTTVATSTFPTSTPATSTSQVTSSQGISKVQFTTTSSPTMAAQQSSGSNVSICTVFVIIIIVLLILIVIVFTALRRRRQHIFIQPVTPSKKNSCESKMSASEVESPESKRYTSSPYNSPITQV